ncbi:MAG: Ribonuclease P protein component [candidate division TM6 bacterium GW2011_GWF2_32_72]|nr:MAG: Ribonuclease P protein component [candidate division TM6 bacterium GW2011_GWF2_32_72]
MTKLSNKLTTFRQKEVQQLFDSVEKRHKNLGLTILLAPKILSYSRILIITPKKTGSAPERNLIRRRLKAIFYEEKLFENNPYDCIVLARPEATKLSFLDLKRILINFIKS